MAPEEYSLGEICRRGAGSNEQDHAPAACEESLITQIIHSRATELARSGHYEEAKILLTELKDGQNNPLVLDLLARIAVQIGHVSEAGILWRRALRLDPSNPAYVSALERLAKIQRPSVRDWHSLRLTLLVLAILLVGTWIFITLSTIRGSTQDTPAEIVSLTSRQNEISERLDTIERILNESRYASLDLQSIAVDRPGVTTRIDGGRLIVTFDEGLFNWGALLKPEAGELITEIGRSLESYAGDILITVTGHTDNLPIRVRSRVPDNFSLGLRRAVAVVEHMCTTSELPNSLFTINSTGETNPPFPNDSSADRIRNRTVSLTITGRDRNFR